MRNMGWGTYQYGGWGFIQSACYVGIKYAAIVALFTSIMNSTDKGNVFYKYKGKKPNPFGQWVMKKERP